MQQNLLCKNPKKSVWFNPFGNHKHKHTSIHRYTWRQINLNESNPTAIFIIRIWMDNIDFWADVCVTETKLQFSDQS